MYLPVLATVLIQFCQRDSCQTCVFICSTIVEQDFIVCCCGSSFLCSIQGGDVPVNLIGKLD